MRKRRLLRGNRAIEIERDAHGTPHVRAADEADLYRGLGYCHGTDRGLQMLLVRILGRGRASEVLEASPEMLRTDAFFRRMNFSGDAAEETARIGPDDRRRVDAYCDGVNRALAERTPWELRLLGYRPEPWSLADTLLTSRVSGFVALAQSQGDLERLFVELVQAGVSRERLEALFPGLLDDVDLDLVARVRLGHRLVPAEVRFASAVPRAVASNNWAVAGRKARDGRALLANDPHLEVNRLPAVWYEIALELGERYCIGATMPGLPAVLLGRTNDLAWGATYTFMDAIDSWIEDCRDGCRRRVVDGHETWVPFRVRREVVKRKGEAPVELVFHESEHGVLDGDPHEPGLLLSTRWSSGSASGAASLAQAFALFHARDVEQGRFHIGRLETAWNWVLADRDGRIAYQMSGLMPLRREGWQGFVPQPGWEPANDWRGFAAPEELPRALDPACGYVVTANDDLNHLGVRRPINSPMGRYRADSIARHLAAHDDWTPEAFEALQMDVASPQAALFMAVLDPLLPPGPAADALRSWDGRYACDSRAAVLFDDLYRALLVEVFGAGFGSEAMRFLLDETPIAADFYAHFDRVLLDPTSAWFAEEARDDLFRRVAHRVLAARSAEATWGERRQLVMRHLLLGGRLPRWLGFDVGPLALAGNLATIHQGQIYRSQGRDTGFAPSYRLVTDLGRDELRTCLAGGPSDRRFSGWYASGVADWLAGRFKTLRPGKTARSGGGNARG